MSKLYRSSAPPAGFDLPVRNVRLYGSRDEQVASRLQRAQVAMFEAQRAVKRARTAGRPATEVRALAYTAREARAAYLRLTGGVERRTVDAPIAATR